MSCVRSLWDCAYEALRSEKATLVQLYEQLVDTTLFCYGKTASPADLNKSLNDSLTRMGNIPPAERRMGPQLSEISSASPRSKLELMISLGQQHMKENQLAIRVVDHEFVLRGQMENVVAGVQFAKNWIDEAVGASSIASTV